MGGMILRDIGKSITRSDRRDGAIGPERVRQIILQGVRAALSALKYGKDVPPDIAEFARRIRNNGDSLILRSDAEDET